MVHCRLALSCAFLAIGLVSIPASARKAPAPQEEIDTDIKAYLGCLTTHAAEMDDGISDAGSIGRAIATSCRAELMTTAEAMGRGENARVNRLLQERLQSHEEEEGTKAVLRVRREAAAANEKN